MVEAIPIPADETAELMVLSSMIQDAEVVGNVLTIIREKSVFTDDRHRDLFDVFSSLYEQNKPLDPVLIAAEINARKLDATLNAAFLDGVISAAPTASHGEYYAVVVQELATKRRMISALNRCLVDCANHDDDVKSLSDRIESRIMEASEVTIPNIDRSLSSLLDDMFKNPTATASIPTGYLDLDQMLIGMHAGEMIVLAARPSVGKSALALNIAEHVAVNLKKPLAFFSLEMKQNSILERLVSSRAGVDLQSIRRNQLNGSERAKLKDAMTELRKGEMFIDDSSALTIMDLRAKARRLKQKRGIQLLILDYLQLMDAPGKSENRQQEIARISRGVKTLACELDIPILCLSQLNRASEIEDRRPRPSDLRESGTIEQDADVVLLLHREDAAHRGDNAWAMQNPEKVNVAELIVGKQRNGPCGMVKLTVRPTVTRFENYGGGGYQGEN